MFQPEVEYNSLCSKYRDQKVNLPPWEDFGEYQNVMELDSGMKTRLGVLFDEDAKLLFRRLFRNHPNRKGLSRVPLCLLSSFHYALSLTLWFV